MLTRQSILRILGEAKDDYPEAKGALLASAARELEVKDEDLFPMLAEYLTGDEIASMMPKPGALDQGAVR